MRISVFSTGRVRLKRRRRGIWRYLVDDWGDETLPVNVFAIEHAGGVCLVDSGQTSAAAAEDYFPRWYPFFRLARFELEPRDEAASQVSRAGVDIRRVRWLVLTHLHTDHMGGVHRFQDAEVIVARKEWRDAQGLRGRVLGYLPERWPDGVDPHVVDFNGPVVGPFPGSHDVASDGRLMFVPLPGHTRGHAALLVRPDGGPSYLCAGDAAIRAGDLRKTAPVIADWCERENVIVLTAHDDAAPRLIAESAGHRQSPRPKREEVGV